VVLRRSVALYVATVVFALTASCAVYTVFVPRCGIAQALWFAAATLLVLTLGMLAYERRRPVALKIGPDGIAALNRAGAVMLAGRIVGFAQWTGLFLVLAVAGRDRKGRVTPLLIPADSLSPDSFRELAVRARHGAR
jgi:hypothetical protein